MKIKRVEINHFGKFKSFSMEFSEGMNFIYGNNEDGKTTLMSFIKMMFYSNVGNSRDLSNLRKKYLPWDGSMMSGALEFEDEGKQYRIQKEFGVTPMRDEVSLYCITDGMRVPLNKEEEVGSHFFHMELDGFERSVFIGQTGGFARKKSEKTDEITERLTNLATSADENISLKEALTHLTAAAEQMVSRRGNAGILVNNKQQLDQITEELALVNEQEAAQRELREEYEVLLRLQKVEKERLAVMQKRRQEELAIYQEINEAERVVNELQNRRERFEIEWKNKQELLEYKINVEEEKLGQAEHATNTEPEKRSFPVFAVLSGLTAVMAVVTTIFLHPYFLLLLLPSAIFLFTEFSRRKRDKRMTEYRQRAEESAKEIRGRLMELRGQQEQEEREVNRQKVLLEQEKEGKGKLLERRRQRYEEVKQQREPELKLELDILMREEAISNIRSRLRTPDKSPEDLRAEKKELEILVKEQQLYYDAATLAVRVMEESAAELRQSFGPNLSRRTAEIFAKLTKDRYKSVMVSKDFGISVLGKEEILYRDGGYLSNGTIDQVYFALRLAIVELLSGNENRHLPILLDDIFEQYDEQRTEDGLDFLSSYTGEQEEQVIMFTCHKTLIHQAREMQVRANYQQLA